MFRRKRITHPIRIAACAFFFRAVMEIPICGRTVKGDIGKVYYDIQLKKHSSRIIFLIVSALFYSMLTSTLNFIEKYLFRLMKVSLSLNIVGHQVPTRTRSVLNRIFMLAFIYEPARDAISFDRTSSYPKILCSRNEDACRASRRGISPRERTLIEIPGEFS